MMKRLIKVPVQLLCIICSFFVVTASAASEVKGSDTIDSYSFNVKIGNVDADNIISVEGLGIIISVVRQPNENNLLTDLRPGRVELGRIILKKKFSANSMLNDWIERVVKGDVEHYRKNIVITLFGHSGKSEESYIVQKWRLYGCFPVSWALSPLSIGSSELPLELLTVACEQLEEESNL